MSIDPLNSVPHTSSGDLQAVPSLVLQEILAWTKSTDLWQQEAVRRILRAGELAEADVFDLIGFAEIQFGIKDGAVAILSLSEKDIPSVTTASTVPLVGVKQLERVNAVRPDQKLSFGKHLTVIYGDNGSGKSGYARLLKRACRARSVSEILPDVYNPPESAHPATACFEFESEGKITEHHWSDDGSKILSALGSFAVFDSDCGKVFIGGKTELAITPFGLDILSKLGTLVDQVKRTFEAHAANQLPNIDALKASVGADTEVGKTLANLTPETRIEFLNKQAQFDKDSEQQLKSLEEQLKQAQSSSPEQLIAMAKESKTYVDALSAFCKKLDIALSDELLTELKRKFEEILTLEQSVKITASRFESEPLSGVGSESWKQLLLAAEKYSTSEVYPKQSFPVPESKCVLCQQDLSPDAYERLQKFWEFLRDETSKKLQEARDAIQSKINILKQLNIDLPDYKHSLPKIFGEESMAKVEEYFQSLKTRHGEILRAVADGEWSGVSKLSPVPNLIARKAAEIATQLDSLAGSSSQEEAISKITLEISELKARKLLKENINLVEQHINASRLQVKYKSAAESLGTRSITAKSKEMQSKFVTEEYKQQLAQELGRMRLSRLAPKVDEKADKGRVYRELSISCKVKHAKPELVFSEGERTAIALACFMAELGTEVDTRGIIFDDPVTSLDHHVRSLIAERLVLEAKTRQVIVFTHDLVFFRELLEFAQLSQIDSTVQCVNSIGDSIGVVVPSPPWEASKIPARTSVLEATLGKAKRAMKEEPVDVEAYKDALELFYKRLRETWERSIEELLFCDVVQRFERGVSTLKLTGVAIDDDGIEKIFEGMTVSSSRVHDLATGVGATSIKIEDAQADLDAFKRFVADQTAKKNAADSRRNHLKDKVKISIK